MSDELNKGIKYMDIKEFHEGGYLQEINRRLLHILGIALEITIDDDGKYSLSGIWDSREDPEGFVFDSVNRDHVIKIQKELDAKINERQKQFGWFLQPYETAEQSDSPPEA